jgi:hypothetical protein
MIDMGVLLPTDAGADKAAVFGVSENLREARKAYPSPQC